MKASDILSYSDPWALFSQWYAEAQANPSLREPTAMTLATADASGQPSARTVLLKKFSPQQGFVFFTNYESRKGHDLLANPKASLLFYWDPLFRQIKIEGVVEKIPREESIQYWNSRPFDSRLAGTVSKQSRPVVGSLDKIYEDARKHWENKEIPCPENWGGFSLKPSSIEFWVGHKFRLHDRVRFTLSGLAWIPQQLYP